MGFTDTLKRSLGFEESEINNNGEGSNLLNRLRELAKNPNANEPNQQQNARANQQQYQPRPRPTQTQVPRPTPTATAYDDDIYVITPEQSLYEIVLIRPKTIDDINYVVDQVIEENNPVILDLSFLEKESPANFKLAGDKIKQMRAHYGAQALLLSRSEEKNLIIVSPKKVKVSNKG